MSSQIAKKGEEARIGDLEVTLENVRHPASDSEESVRSTKRRKIERRIRADLVYVSNERDGDAVSTERNLKEEKR